MPPAYRPVESRQVAARLSMVRLNMPLRAECIASRAGTQAAAVCLLVMAAVWTLVHVQAPRARAQDEEVGKFEVHEWSFWGIDSTQDLANALDQYASAMPGPVETERTRVPKDHKAAPLAVMTFHGEPSADLEVEVQIPTGRVLANWPPARRKNNRIRWLELQQSAQPFEGVRTAPVDSTHWFERARALESLYLRSGSRGERFLTYDIELPLSVPLRLEGGPDVYRVVNLSAWELSDVVISVPTPEGRRIGRVSTVPASAAAPPGVGQPPQNGTPAVPPRGAAPGAAGQAGGAPPVDVPPANAQAAETPAIDVPAELQPQEASPQPPPAADQAAKPGDAGQPQGPPSAPVAAPGSAAANQTAAEPPGIEVVMSPPLPDDAGELAAMRAQLVESLIAAGLTPGEAELAISLVAESVLQSSELVVLVRLPQAAADEKLPLVFYPRATKTVRVPLLLVRKVDPRIKDEVQQLVAQLGSMVYAEREAADKRLRELGRLAVPALKECLTSPDLEVVFRAERMLLALNESIDPPQQPNNPAVQGASGLPAAVQVLVAPGK